MGEALAHQPNKVTTRPTATSSTDVWQSRWATNKWLMLYTKPNVHSVNSSTVVSTVLVSSQQYCAEQHLQQIW